MKMFSVVAALAEFYRLGIDFRLVFTAGPLAVETA